MTKCYVKKKYNIYIYSEIQNIQHKRSIENSSRKKIYRQSLLNNKLIVKRKNVRIKYMNI